MFRKPDGAGKGDAPRPIKDQEQYRNNWNAIFKKKEECKFCLGLGYDASGQICSCVDKK